MDGAGWLWFRVSGFGFILEDVQEWKNQMVGESYFRSYENSYT